MTQRSASREEIILYLFVLWLLFSLSNVQCPFLIIDKDMVILIGKSCGRRISLRKFKFELKFGDFILTEISKGINGIRIFGQMDSVADSDPCEI